MNSSVPQPKSPISFRRIASNYLYTAQGLLPHPLIEVDAEGHIRSVEQCAEPDRQAGVEFYAGILLPGLVNAHCHLELSHLRGVVPEGVGFVPRDRKIFDFSTANPQAAAPPCGDRPPTALRADLRELPPEIEFPGNTSSGQTWNFARFLEVMHEARARFSPEERTRAAFAADAELWREGVQAVGDIASGESAFAAKAQSRIAYRTFVEVFGLRSDSTDRLRPLLRHPNTSLTPHSAYSLQDNLFRSVCAEGDAPLSIHFLESPAEAELFQRRGALYTWYQQLGISCDFLHYGLPAERIIKSIPCDRSVLLVHNCCVTQRDIDLIMNHFRAPVWWCLCPRSNYFISRLEPPVELLRRNGLNICLGTDSLASNDRLSMLHEMQMLRGVPLDELLRWATVNGAAALGKSGELGEVAPGRRCGLNVLSGIDYERMELTVTARIQRIL